MAAVQCIPQGRSGEVVMVRGLGVGSVRDTGQGPWFWVLFSVATAHGMAVGKEAAIAALIASEEVQAWLAR